MVERSAARDDQTLRGWQPTCARFMGEEGEGEASGIRQQTSGDGEEEEEDFKFEISDLKEDKEEGEADSY